jgi:hypothetical protein
VAERPHLGRVLRICFRDRIPVEHFCDSELNARILLSNHYEMN